METSDQPRSAAILSLLARDGGALAYNALALAGAPFLLWRKWRLKRFLHLDCEFDPARWNIRFPDASSAREARDASGPRVQFVTLGWGEVATMRPLIEALRAARPDARIGLSVMHREAIEAARALSDDEVLPLPFDHPLPVARWHARAKPDLVVFYERFNMALLLRSLWLARVPFAIVHARMSAKRANNRGSLNLKLKRWQLRGLRDILLPTPDYAPGSAQIAPTRARLHVVGSIKFPHHQPPIPADLRAWIEAGTAGAPLLVAGSTHETEEAWVLDAWEKVRASVPENAPILLLAPRKPERADDVAQLLRARGLRVSRRSQWDGDASDEAVDVLLLDTLGELGAAYGLAMGAFVGGTLSGDSHNVAEPLVWSIPVAYGPRRGNFGVEQTLCEAAGVGLRVETPDQLAAHWTQLAQSSDLRRELAAKAQTLVAAQRGAFERTLQVLVDAVDEIRQDLASTP